MLKPHKQPEIRHDSRSEHRLASNPREMAFLRAWQEQQKLSHTLQWLLCVSSDQQDQERDLTQVEAHCAATLMQWLGSPVGFSFLEDALKRCGMKAV